MHSQNNGCKVASRIAYFRLPPITAVKGPPVCFEGLSMGVFGFQACQNLKLQLRLNDDSFL